MFISFLICSIAGYDPVTTCPDLTNQGIGDLCSDLKEGSANTLDSDKLGASSKYRCCRQGIAGDITIKTDIPDEAFYKSTKIHKVSITSDCTSIGNYAFFGCTNLILDVSFDNALNSIEESAFEGCISLSKDIKFAGSKIGAKAFKDCTNLAGSLNLASRSEIVTQSIGASAFEGTQIKSISNIDKVASIGQRAFYSTKITSALKFSKLLTNIGKRAFENVPISGLTFVETDSKQLVIDDHAFENTIIDQEGDLVIPDSCQKLGIYAFARIKFKGTVSLGEQIVSIPEYLFYNSTITKIISSKNSIDNTDNTFHENLISIGKHAFDHSELSGTISFGNYIQNIGTYAFQSTKISGSINLPDSLQTIGKFAFNNCTLITGEITPRKQLTEIGDNAFENTGISGKLTIEDTLEIGKRTFAGTALTELIIYNEIPESAFEGITAKITTLKVDLSSVDTKDIGKNAFRDCEITSIMEFDNANIFPDAFYNAKFTNTNSDAKIFFKDCNIAGYAFRSFQISGSSCIINLTDTGLYKSAFETMSGKPRVVFHHVVDTDNGDNEEEAPSYVIESYAFYNTGIQGDLAIPRFVKDIGSYAFAYCSGLTGNLDINATNIYNHAFYECKFAGVLSLGSQVEKISAFKDDENNQIVEASESLTFKGCGFSSLQLNNKGAIPSKAFYKMTTIKAPLTIPETVTSIAKEAFAGCDQIPSLTFESNPNSDLTYGASTLDLGLGCFMGCSGISNDLVINRALASSSIGSYAFHGCSKIRSLNFDTKLTTINSHAFYKCTSLTSVTFPIEINYIGINAFAECTELSGNLNLHQARYINGGAFSNCAKLTGPLDLSYAYYIGDGAFSGCTGFNENLTLYNPTFYEQIPTLPGYPNLPYIGSSAFRGCKNLKGSLLLSRFEEIGEYAFYDCSGLDGQLVFPGIDVEDYTFYGCSGLNGPLVLSSSDSIGKYAFYGCSGFSGELILSDSISTIDEYAFAKCSGLTGPLEFPGTINYIGRGAFSDCTGFSDHLNIVVGDNKEVHILAEAFKGCSGFKKGDLSFYILDDERIDQTTGSNYYSYYRFPYFLRIQNKAFDGTKFKNIYYNGRFQPDCDYDIGISSIKGIHTSSNYANKTFCGNPVHKSKLSGGAIAGIVIACIVVVALIVALIVWLIMRNKKNKDNSEGEVEMNNEP